MKLDLGKVKEEVEAQVKKINGLYNTCRFGHDQYCLYYSLLDMNKKIIHALEEVEKWVNQNRNEEPTYGQICGGNWYKASISQPEANRYIWVTKYEKGLFQYSTLTKTYKGFELGALYYWTYVIMPKGMENA